MIEEGKRLMVFHGQGFCRFLRLFVDFFFLLFYEMIPAFFKISCTPTPSDFPATSSVQNEPTSLLSSGSTLQFGLWSALSHLKSSTWSQRFSCVSDHGGVFSR